MRSIAIAATEQLAVCVDDHFDQTWCRPVFIKKASEDCLEVFADLDLTELSCAVLSNLVGIADGGVVEIHWFLLSAPNHTKNIAA